MALSHLYVKRYKMSHVFHTYTSYFAVLFLDFLTHYSTMIYIGADMNSLFGGRCGVLRYILPFDKGTLLVNVIRNNKFAIYC